MGRYGGASDNRYFECIMYDDEIPGDEIVTLSCNHRFCAAA